LLAGVALKGLGNMLHLDHQLAAGLDAEHAQLDVALLDALGLLLAHLAQAADTALVALAARRYALARPLGFADDAPVHTVLLRGLGGHPRLGPGIEAFIPLVVIAQPASVEPQGPARHTLQKSAVVADGENAGRMVGKALLQPLHHGDVE